MKCALLMVGSELLGGQMIDSNSAWIAGELNQFGIKIIQKIILPDDVDEICLAIQSIYERVDLVIISGGLGPTIDDVTREAIAKFVNRELLLNKDELENIKNRFQTMPSNNIKQAMFPKDSILFDNQKGVAKSFFIEKIVAFPGVPAELFDSFPRFLNYWANRYQLKICDPFKDLLLWGIPESKLEENIIDIIKRYPDVFVEFLVKDYAIIVRLNPTCRQLEQEIYERVGSNIFGENFDRLEQIVAQQLINNNLTISTAESCTAGLVSAYLGRVSGISSVLIEAIVTYSNDAKIKRLNVLQQTLDNFGAVSKEVVIEMLLGLQTVVGIAVSGVAGPTGGTERHPVGTVIIGIKVQDSYFVEDYFFRGDRQRVQHLSAMTALFQLHKKLKDCNFV